jgi:hypothetical protein
VCSAALFPALMSCTQLVSSVSVDPNNGSAEAGIVYALPKGQMLVTATRGPVDVSALITSLSTAQAALVTAMKTPAGGTAPAATDPGPAAAQLAVDAATAKLDLLAPLVGGVHVPTMQETVSLTALPFVPDPYARYVAKFDHEPWRDDNLQLTVSNGLLSSSSLVSQDQTPAIVSSLASTILSLTAGVPTPGKIAPLARPAAAPPPAPSCDYSFAQVFDPFNAEELDKLNTSLSKIRSDSNLTINAVMPGSDGLTSLPSLPAGTARPDRHLNETPGTQPAIQKGDSGLFYRIASPVVVTADYNANAISAGSCKLSGIPVVTPVTAIVPDSRRGQQMRVEASAGWLTTTTIGLTFTNGMLSSQSVQRPSELLTLAGLPASIISQYTTILTNFLQLRVNYATADAAIATQRATQLSAQITQLQNVAQLALAGPTEDAKSRLALLQIQQQLQQLQLQLQQPTTAP